ncbi:hypothetical protein MPHL43072_14685 [Mycolicibacterium phlei DSM 43072]|uniref:Uncharacterized protein n=1 Tax=Mycolicibacterium phlei DSM 43239 = CCUG 21000 TaxID=1226750 RepID=A0A5N5UPM3_MYCPH|nr:hypothetical protein MPHL21000_24975 [Mycolicibacterium phlei DSM 43239 = CCUG 21000]KXW68155.1 hypothetical protein MPHL43239_03840 [Mycolicibacterium phlei DSM 43239 = CCUG 21000]KXW68338.1 hypothetical protein MPHL43070_04455 [Mycolicibacterium phlei DSM 43070]KXW71729.1 hypothetical protein MPHL43072_14685 [Mycolicibacterium phlei DSM 43072]KXW76062.1 hypothetical protein JL15_18820 [Mycolicibacterium phlei DSM 43071]
MRADRLSASAATIRSRVAAIESNGAADRISRASRRAAVRYRSWSRMRSKPARSARTVGVAVPRSIPAPQNSTRAAISALSEVSPATMSGTPWLSAYCTPPYPPLVIITSTWGISIRYGSQSVTRALPRIFRGMLPLMACR